MAKQGDRDRPNPRLCPSDKLDAVMEAPILGFHQGRRSMTAPEGRIDDCKPARYSAQIAPHEISCRLGKLDQKIGSMAGIPAWRPSIPLICDGRH